ncbi:MAG TPA: hypothetical protein PLI09_01200 [Candidatus Hydrogenedentes bacterium]|nr:hypothetical protein [Candidatus Hydrogenedentota bacterium]
MSPLSRRAFLGVAAVSAAKAGLPGAQRYQNAQAAQNEPLLPMHAAAAPSLAQDRGGMDLSEVRREVMAYITVLQVPGKPYGCYRLKPSGEAELYATCDVAILRTVMGESLKQTLSDQQRQEWIAHINSFAQEDGEYKGGRHSKQHRNGMVIGALGVLGGKQKYPIRFYGDFNTIEKVEPWLEQIAWSRLWESSHLFWGGMHCYSMSSACTDAWRDAVFTWLDANLDPETGWWRKGEKHSDTNQPLGGGAHLWPIYQHHTRPFPYPEKVIDSILALQRADGSWLSFGSYLDLDALYGLSFMHSLAPDHRANDVRGAVRRYGDLALARYAPYLAGTPDTHHVLGTIGGLGLLHQLDPERFHDTVKWSDIFSDARFYDTQSVECLKE